jgi:hypothetical protein
MLAIFGIGGYVLYTYMQAHPTSAATNTGKPVLPVGNLPQGATVSSSAPGSTSSTLAPGSVIVNTDGSTQVVNNDGSLTIPS